MSLRKHSKNNRKVSRRTRVSRNCHVKKLKDNKTNELQAIKKTLKVIHKDITNLNKDELDENSISISIFKVGIIIALVLVFLVMFIATIKSTCDVFLEKSRIVIIFLILSIVSMILLIFLSNLEKKYPLKKKIFKRLSSICISIICLYISVAVMISFIADMILHNEDLTNCSVLHFSFCGLGLVISLMIQEVWNTRDKNFVYAFVALVWALAVEIVNK